MFRFDACQRFYKAWLQPALFAGFAFMLSPVGHAESFTQSQKLALALADYTRISAAGGWPRIGLHGEQLRAGQRHADVKILRNRLKASGDWRGQMQADPLYFSQSLANALQAFQIRHGLISDGVLDERSRAALAVSVDERIASLRLNIQRWKSQALETTGRHIIVNIPGGDLRLFEDRQQVLKLRAIAGRPYRPTPQLSSAISKVVLNPGWSVPRRIAVEDLLPLQQQNPRFFERKKISAHRYVKGKLETVDAGSIDWQALSANNFPYRLHQQAGPSNSMGSMKFVFPNSHSVYLHDTPNKELFDLPTRMFSSGCVRLEHPEALAAALMGPDKAEDLDAILDSGRTASVAVTKTAIHLSYFTSWVEENGRVHFARDIYGLDAEEMKAAAISL